ncbi:MAG: glycerophosphodiester phosphodiesterase [Sphingomonadaceae bacterium]|nr:glycerophosphodiester phosphodiesterase [Sphingomonadaceae bacterium]MCP5393029.1 glycerophosphodiester phosphodiesterase [Sphingomonadaceae bacterium]
MRSLLSTWIDNWRSPPPRAARVKWLAEWDYAHRGLHTPGTPENSPSAFAEAIGRGMGIECDVQRTADSGAVVFHDWELDRLTERKGPVEKLTVAELAEVGLKGNGDRIPSLERLLEQVGGRVPLLIEIKSRHDRRVRPLCLAVRRALEGYQGHHAVMSFDPRVSRWFSVHSPRTVRGLVVTEEGEKGVIGKVKRKLSLWQARPDFLAYDVRDLPSPFAAAQRKRGLPLLTWTVRSPELAQVAFENTDAPILEGEALL